MNPLALVREWFEAAAASGVVEAERMALATATPDGRPSVRIVLLKGIDDDGDPVLHQLRLAQGP